MKNVQRNAKKLLAVLLCLALTAAFAACKSTAPEETQEEDTSPKIVTNLDKVDMSKWQYNEDDDVYWQVGLSYCESPQDEDYESMGIFVPGAYFTAEENEDGTYTCALKEDGKVGDFTAKTAPVVIPVETPGYAAMNPPTEYTSLADYMEAGFVYLYAGARGRDHGAPAGVTDFKAAIRYYRYTADLLPGDPEKVFSFGMSGGGAQSALIGSTGDSELYTPYLEQIGAVSGVSDAVLGSMCWCPITNLDVGDAAYEWNMGSARTGLDEDTQKLSDGLATEFASYINDLKLTDAEGNVLTLKESDNGIYQKGSYYNYLKDIVEDSLQNFLKDNEFPYDTSSASKSDSGMMLGGGGFGGFGKQGGQKPSEDQSYEQMDQIDRTGGSSSSGLTISGTFETAEDYIAALNQESEWVKYDAETKTVSITSLADFVKYLKTPSKSVGAFDDLQRTQGENTLFGYADGEGAHFDAIEASLLKGTDYEEAFTEDLARKDALGNTVDYRVNMYNPMYYLCDYYEGNGTSELAKYFRIRTGINQGDTALCTEVDLALALAAAGVDVDFATVWGQGHTKAERTGTSDENFIEWVKTCVNS